MAANPKDIKGAIAVAGHIDALPGKADELAQLFANARAAVQAGKAPGTLQYNIVRHGDVFGVFEVYKDLAAFEAHQNHPQVKEAVSTISKIAKQPEIFFFPAESLPEPTVTF